MNPQDKLAFWGAVNGHLKDVEAIMYASSMYPCGNREDKITAKVINDVMVIVRQPAKTTFHNLVKKESYRGETWQAYHRFEYHPDDGEGAFEVEFTLYWLNVEARLLPIYLNEEEGGPPIYPAILEEQNEIRFGRIIGVRFGYETEAALESLRTDARAKDQLRQWTTFCHWLKQTCVLLKCQGADL